MILCSLFQYLFLLRKEVGFFGGFGLGGRRFEWRFQFCYILFGIIESYEFFLYVLISGLGVVYGLVICFIFELFFIDLNCDLGYGEVWGRQCY